MDFHADPIDRAQLIGRYVLRRLDKRTEDEFEAHYLGCHECFDELTATEALISGLLRPTVQSREIEDVVLLDFPVAAELTAGSLETEQLSKQILGQSDKKVLIDMERVSRIDSTGLGVLLSCYSHVVRNQGSFKLLRIPEKVQKLFEITKIGSLLEAYEDEAAALRSFRS